MAKLSDLSDQDWFQRLNTRRVNEARAAADWWQYYEGNQPLYFVAKILQEQENRFPALTINWCEKFVDWIDARSYVEGFRVGEDDVPDARLWEIWQRNDLDEEQSENNVASLVTGVSYAMVAPGDDGRALITIEAPELVTVEIDPRTRKVIAGLKVWKSDEQLATEDMAELWLPGRLVTFAEGEPDGEQKQTSTDVGIFPFWNRRRRLRGRSELSALRPLVDAANQVATNMMAGAEHHAVPRKWALGVSENNFKDKDGNAIPAWKIATGAVWVNPIDEDNPEAKPEVGQFAATDLRNFHDTVSLIGRIGAGLCDMAPSEFGFGVADNPASADGINAAKESGVRRVERILTARGGAYEKAMRHAAAIEGMDPAPLQRMETVWRDPSTPTQQAKVQAASVAYTSGLADLRQAREDAGYSDTQIKAMEAREQEARDRDVEQAAAPLVRALGGGLSGNAAAPVGE